MVSHHMMSHDGSHDRCGKTVHRPCSSCISSIENLTGTPLSSPCQLGKGRCLSHYIDLFWLRRKSTEKVPRYGINNVDTLDTCYVVITVTPKLLPCVDGHSFFFFNNLLHRAHRQTMASTKYLLRYKDKEKEKRWVKEELRKRER